MTAAVAFEEDWELLRPGWVERRRQLHLGAMGAYFGRLAAERAREELIAKLDREVFEALDRAAGVHGSGLGP